MCIRFTKEKQLDLQIQYSSRSNEVLLKKLRNSYELDKLIDEEKSDYENIINVQSWVYSRWDHDSENIAKKNDVFYILEQAAKGKRFRCAEYSTVSKACLQALGFTVRELWLRSRDEELVKRNSCHVMNEIYLKDLKKWFFMDPCFDIMIKKNGIPLNAVELLQSLLNGEELEVINPSNEITCEEYLEKIGPFLFYFSTSLNKEKSGILDLINGSRDELILVPVQEETSAFFKKNINKRNSITTNSIADFYPEI